MSSPAPSPPVNSTSPPPLVTPAPQSPPAVPAAPAPAAPVVPPPSPPPAAPVTPVVPPPSPSTTPAASPPPPAIVNPTPPATGSPPATPSNPPSAPSPPSNPTSPGGNPPSGGSPTLPSGNPPSGGSPPRAPNNSGGGSPVPNGDSSSGNSGISTTAIIGIAVGGVLILVILGLVVCCLRRKPKRKYRRDDEYGTGQYKAGMYEAGRRPPPPPPPPPPHKHHAYGSPGPPPPPPPPLHYSSSGSQDSWKAAPPPPPPPPPPHSMGSSRSWFTYDELEAATGGFSRANLLGEGGFGCVYKGTLPGGQLIAVKQLKVGSGQGEREFRAEVEIISRVHHRHLVSLVGYCIADTQRLLVYDYVPNGTLEHNLHGKGRPVMPWATRLKTAAGSARGLAYLHEDCHPRIIHRDIKSSNILLDNNFEAQVSDFGLAKLASDTYTHVTTRVMGTFGYLAPEYASTGKLTEKSDVYSFGVVLLELITGRRPVDTTQPIGDESLVEWARPALAQALEDGNLDSIVDRRLVDYNENEMLRMVEAAAACVRHSASKRPRMAQVVRALESDAAIADLNQGVKPGHSSNFGSSDYESGQYASDMRKFRKTAFGSQEQGGSGYPTSEYGLNPSASSSEGLSSLEMERRKQHSATTDTSSSEMNGNRNNNSNNNLYGR